MNSTKLLKWKMIEISKNVTKFFPNTCIFGNFLIIRWNPCAYIYIHELNSAFIIPCHLINILNFFDIRDTTLLQNTFFIVVKYIKTMYYLIKYISFSN